MIHKNQNRISRRCRAFFLLLLTIILTGCGTLELDTKEADLMPHVAAMAIFKKNGLKLENWSENPFVVNTSPLCGTDRVYVKFEEIESATYLVQTKQLMFHLTDRGKSLICPGFMARFDNLTEYQARELTTAARSLGARIDKLTWAY